MSRASAIDDVDLSLIERTPRVCGGRARIAGTRIAVWLVESLRRQGATVPAVLRMYPQLREEQVRSAWSYAQSHPEEIEADIQEQQDA